MKFKKLFLTWLLVFITFEILNAVIHGALLGNAYKEIMNVWRPNMMDLMWLMYVVDAFVVYMIVYIFTKGYENKGIAEGLRYGLVIGLLMNVAGSAYQYMMYPLPGSLVIHWFVYGMIQYLICGVVLAYAYKKF